MAFAVVLFSSVALAQDIGCCCDPVVKNGSFDSKADCEASSFIFVGPPPDIATTCSEHCNATLVPTREGVCGDDICQEGESESTCPSDCGPRVGCGSPTFRPAPSNAFVTPIKAKRELKVNFGVPCPAEFLVISRCEGRNCTQFSEIARIPPTSSFVDRSDDLRFNQDYTYRVVANYRTVGESLPATAIGNLGDVECLDRASDTFCISELFYEGLRSYLVRFGYGFYQGPEFSQDFSRATRDTFATRFNRAWSCNEANRLISKMDRPCVGNTVCVADESVATCVSPVDCSKNSIPFDPFGLFSSIQSCEGILSRFCFFDRSTTAQNACYACSEQMSCFDYKTRGACERDNCNAGDCEWKPIFDDLGSGVCVDKRKNNCRWCSLGGTSTVGTNDVESDVLDTCTEEKSDALSTDAFPCFFDRDRKVSKSCEQATCADYPRRQCASSSPGIRLGRDNNVVVPSADPCGIGVCEYQATTGCVKNADGSSGAGFQDCKFGNTTCEQDYFRPSTTMVPAGVAGRSDILQIRIFDRVNASASSRDFTSQPGYRSFLCIESEVNSCSDARNYNIVVSSDRLIVKNLDLKEGNRTLARLRAGNNTVHFYSKDASDNVEIKKTATFFACTDCQGPTLLNITITGGRVLNNTLFTSVATPTIGLTFDEPMLISYAELRGEEGAVPLVQLTQGMRAVHELQAGVALNGTYTLSVNGRNAKEIYIDPPGLEMPLIVDTERSSLRITPVEGSILNVSAVDVVLNFSSEVTLDNVSLVLESFSDEFVKRSIPREITSDFETTDNRSFSAKVTNVTGGKYSLRVRGRGFNSLLIEGQTSFFIGTQKPSIRLVEPSFGVTPNVVFTANVETPLPSTCGYVFNTPTAPSAQDFPFFKKFNGNRFLHPVSGLEIPGGEGGYQLHTYCSFNRFGVVQRSFNITFDAEPPVIKNAFAAPSIVSEEFIPGERLYVTQLMVELDKPGFCKWSKTVPHFASMEGRFPGFDTTPKKSLIAEVNVSKLGQHTFHVACKGLNELLTSPTTITFTVDLTVPLTIESTTPQGSPTSNFTLGVVANKRVFCYRGDRLDDITTCMGICTTDYAHRDEVTTPGEGSFSFFVQCSDLSGDKSEAIEVPVLVDSSPPQMEYVNDESTLNDTDVSSSRSRIRVAFKGNDEESGISHYLMSLKSLDTKEFVFKDVRSNVTDGEAFYVTSAGNSTPLLLNDGEHYQFIVRAVNKVFLDSRELESDGVRIDVTREDPSCDNNEQDPEETGVDCGGSCGGCAQGATCSEDSDCATGFCSNGICELTSCEDSIRNGVETDLDCGGEFCPSCASGNSCLENTDCQTNYCDKTTKLCIPAPACENNELSEGETDIDCGGSCRPCGEDQTCVVDDDCEGSLKCNAQKVCSSEEDDSDGDGVLDSDDGCVATPSGEEVDESGCSLSQKFTVGDNIDDKWRLDNFGCLTCPEADGSADPDGDGLTNSQEFSEGANPKDPDSDGDGWVDGDELGAGFSPVDASSHPTSRLTSVLWIVFVLLIVAGVAYGVFIVLQSRKKPRAKKEETAVKAPASAQPRRAPKTADLSALKGFASGKKQAVQDDWVPVGKVKRRKQVPKREEQKPKGSAIDRLRRMSSKSESADPVKNLRSLLKDLPKRNKEETVLKYKELVRGGLPKEERDELLEKLKATAKDVKSQKKGLAKELREHEGK